MCLCPNTNMADSSAIVCVLSVCPCFWLFLCITKPPKKASFASTRYYLRCRALISARIPVSCIKKGHRVPDGEFRYSAMLPYLLARRACIGLVTRNSAQQRMPVCMYIDSLVIFVVSKGIPASQSARMQVKSRLSLHALFQKIELICVCCTHSVLPESLRMSVLKSACYGLSQRHP